MVIECSPNYLRIVVRVDDVKFEGYNDQVELLRVDLLDEVELKVLLVLLSTVDVSVDDCDEDDKATDDDDDDDDDEVEMTMEKFEEMIEDDVETIGATWYMLRRFEPPQYSVELARQIILQPLTEGTVLVWFTEPVLH